MINFPFKPQYRNIIPLTFDDSLTYYEQMLNLYNVINDCYKQLEEISSGLEEIVKTSVDKILNIKLPKTLEEAKAYTDGEVTILQTKINNINSQLETINNKIANQYSQITKETDSKIYKLQSNINTVSDALKELSDKVSDLDSRYNEMYEKLVVVIDDYMTSLSLIVYCWNPVDANYVPIENALNDAYNYSRYGQFNVHEYDEMHYTASEFEKRFNVKQWLQNVKHFWLFKKLQTVFNGFTGNLGDGREALTHFTDWMKPYPLTAKEYDDKNVNANTYDEKQIDAYNYDFNGRYEIDGYKEYHRIDSVRDIPMVEKIDVENRVEDLEVRVNVIENDLSENVAGSLASDVKDISDSMSNVNANLNDMNNVVNSISENTSINTNDINTLQANVGDTSTLQKGNNLTESCNLLNQEQTLIKSNLTQTNNNVGDLSLLNTSDKTSVVNAINSLGDGGHVKYEDVDEVNERPITYTRGIVVVNMKYAPIDYNEFITFLDEFNLNEAQRQVFIKTLDKRIQISHGSPATLEYGYILKNMNNAFEFYNLSGNQITPGSINLYQLRVNPEEILY